MAARHDFAVLDVETTGFSPARNDRVIEIAIVRIDSDGKTLGEYATLLNPCRDVGPTHVHGITASDVAEAPRFHEIAGDVTAMLAGAVFVAHNVHFDMRFVKSEFSLAGYELPEFPFLCTMQLARRADADIPNRRLNDLCAYFGIRLDGAHSALADARATSELLRTCTAKVAAASRHTMNSLGVCGKPVPRSQWPLLQPSGISYPRRQARQQQSCADRGSGLSRLVARLPASVHTTASADEYLSLLDRVLDDRVVTQDEVDTLLSLASELGMSRGETIAAHRSYMRDLIRVAFEDDVITHVERRDMDDVRQLLGMSMADYESLFAEVRAERSKEKPRSRRVALNARDLHGKTVCFTGESLFRISGQPISRPQAESIAEERGMVVRRTVTKKLDFLIVADPRSMSTKTQRARRYGVRILAESVFWRLTDVDAVRARALDVDMTAAERPGSAHFSREDGLAADGTVVIRYTEAEPVTSKATQNAGKPLAGKTIVVTGSLGHFGRKEIERLIKDLGGRPAAAVSKKTDFVLAGDKPGSKLDKARKLGVHVLDEEAFLALAGIKTG